MQNRSRTPWIVCGVLALIVLCGGGFVLAGGLGALAYLGSRAEATAQPTQVAVQAVTSRPPTLQPTPPAGDTTGVPYRAVVQIIAYVTLEGQVQPGWNGSGSIITPDGLILTNAHVVLSDRNYKVDHLVVALTDKPDEPPQPRYIARILQADQELDVAVIRVETNLDGSPVDRASLNLPTVRMGDSGKLNLGDRLTIMGYPSIGGVTITLTRGEVAGFTAEEKFGKRAFIKTSANISGGNSGGLAADDQGELIGIPTQLGYGGSDQYVDCRVLADTNRDGKIDQNDSCVPTGGFINALRPLQLALPYIAAAKRGEVSIKEGTSGQQGSVPTEQPTQILFHDDFSDPKSGWPEDDWESGTQKYENGAYQLTVKKPKWLLWTYLDQDEADQLISVDTRVVTPTGSGDFGVICRLQDDENYYALEVTEDGYFSIWKELKNKSVPLVDWTFSDAIPAGKPFQVNAACVGNHLLLGVNDTLLASVDDDSFSKGKFGLVAGTLEKGGMTVAFDNFTVYKP